MEHITPGHLVPYLTLRVNISPVNQAPRGGPTRNKLQKKRVQCRVLPKGMQNIIQTFYMLFRGLKENALSKNHFFCNLFQVQLCTDWTTTMHEQHTCIELCVKSVSDLKHL